MNIVVLGGGVAGRAAAGFLREHDADTRLLDEPMPDPSWSLGGERVWGVGPATGGFRVDGLGPDGGFSLDCAALIVCAGAWQGIPDTTATRLLRAGHRFDAARGGWVPMLDEWQRTSVPYLYAAGDCAGTGGDAAAEGVIAAQAVLMDLRLHPAFPTSAVLARTEAAAVAGPVLCACENVTEADIQSAIAAGAREMNQVKAFTRAGMGICQGRDCAAGIAAALGEHAGLFTARIPLRPVPMAAVLGRFDYADIPMPKPAPI
jgi:NADPH-dependent 2,4-dienoyl-CoA reductase/sulfur reductase-like enzyme